MAHNSLRAGVEEVAAGADAPGEAEQPDLLGDGEPSLFECKPVGRGRPKGARSLATQQIIDFVQANYRSPLLGIEDVAAMSPQQIMKAFEIGSEKAADIWLKCAVFATEMRYGKATQRVANSDGSKISSINLVFDMSQVADPDIVGGRAMEFAESEEFQGLSPSLDFQSSPASLHDEEKP